MSDSSTAYALLDLNLLKQPGKHIGNIHLDDHNIGDCFDEHKAINGRFKMITVPDRNFHGVYTYQCDRQNIYAWRYLHQTDKDALFEQDLFPIMRETAVFGDVKAQQTRVDLRVRRGFDININEFNKKTKQNRDALDARQQQASSATSSSSKKSNASIFEKESTPRDIHVGGLLGTLRVTNTDEIADLAREAFGYSQLQVVPYKINIFEKGDFFKPHPDSPSPFLLATAVVSVRGKSSELVLHDDGKEYPFEGDVCLFLPEVWHEVKPVSEYRETVTYKIFWHRPVSLSKQLSDKSPCTVSLVSRIHNVRKPFGVLLQNGYTFFHEATLAQAEVDVQSNIPRALVMKGADRSLLQSIEEMGLSYHFVPVLVMKRDDEDNNGHGFGHTDKKTVWFLEIPPATLEEAAAQTEKDKKARYSLEEEESDAEYAQRRKRERRRAFQKSGRHRVTESDEDEDEDKEVGSETAFSLADKQESLEDRERIHIASYKYSVYHLSEKAVRSWFPQLTNAPSVLTLEKEHCPLYYLGNGFQVGEVLHTGLYVGNQYTGQAQDNVYVNVMLYVFPTI